jgi:hypothetical protein
MACSVNLTELKVAAEVWHEDGAITQKNMEDQQLSMLRKRLREMILAEKAA